MPYAIHKQKKKPRVRSRQASDSRMWEVHKEQLRILWLEQNQTLDQIVRFMSEFHNFHANTWEYEEKFSEWQFRKNLKEAEWRAIAQAVTTRDRQEKKSEVFCCGIHIPKKRLRRRISPYKSSPLVQTDLSLPPGVEIKTPKVGSANLVMAPASNGRRSPSLFRPLLPKLEMELDCFDTTSQLLVDSSFDFSLSGSTRNNFWGSRSKDEMELEYFDTTSQFWIDPSFDSSLFENSGNNFWESLYKDELVLANPFTAFPFETRKAVLPIWATRHGKKLHNLPWLQFQALVNPCVNQTMFDGSLDGLFDVVFGENPNQIGQQDESLMLEVRKKAIDRIMALGKQRVNCFCIEEIMPALFQIETSPKSQTTQGLQGSSEIVQLADMNLFLTANNLLTSSESVALLKEIFANDQQYLLEDLFQQKTPTVQAFSSRLLENICETSASDYLLQQLLTCGMDRSILAGATGGRCLQWSIYNRNTRLSILLLESGVQQNPVIGAKTPFNKTPVQLAKEKNEHEILRILLGKEKRQVFEPQLPKKSKKELALREACSQDSIEKLQLLLSSGLDVDCDRGHDYEENQPMLDWTYFNNREYYDILLPHSSFAKKFWTISGMLSAARVGHKELEMYHSSRSHPDELEYGNVLDHLISTGLENGLTNEVSMILRVECLHEWMDLEKYLVEAAQYENIEIVVALVDFGADMEILQETAAWESDNLVSELFNKAMLYSQGYHSLHQLLDIGWPFDLREAFTHVMDMEAFDRDSFDLMPILKIIIERGLNLNTGLYSHEDDEIRTPLQMAIRYGTPEIVEYLVDSGAMVSGMASEGHFTALGEAVRSSNNVMVELLIRLNADIHAFANDSGMTVLELSVSHEHVIAWHPKLVSAIFNLLLEKGADINGPRIRRDGAKWNTTLTTAILSPCTDEQIKCVLDAGADINQQGGGEMARTPLQAAAETGRLGIARELIKRGASINAPPAPNMGRTALQAACGQAKRFPEMIEFLLNAGADINAPPAERFGRTTFQALCTSETPSSDLMLLLIQWGADIHAPAGKHGGLTALQGAAIMGNIKIVMLLLDMEADVNAPPAEYEGRMALDGAAEHGRLDTVQLLLNFGASCITPGLTGHDSAIHFAEENGHFVVADILRKSDPDEVSRHYRPYQPLPLE